MGTCVSLHKDPGSAMRFKVGAGTEEKKVDGLDCKGKIVDYGLAGSDFGSKDEVFFDTKAWMDSDCEDDFYSVKGDFTPSRGSTPVHPSCFPGTPQLNKTFIDVFPDTPSEPSPRKKLAQLFLETSAHEKVGNGQVVDDEVEKEAISENPATNNDLSANSLNGTPYFSETDHVNISETTLKGGLPNGKVKNDKVTPCCLPSVHGFSMYEWKKQRASPKPHNGVLA